MASIKTLLTARLVSLFLSFAFTICVVGLSGKSLSNLHHDRELAVSIHHDATSAGSPRYPRRGDRQRRRLS
jgi:hypothetical protein